MHTGLTDTCSEVFAFWFCLNFTLHVLEFGGHAAFYIFLKTNKKNVYSNVYMTLLYITRQKKINIKQKKIVT